MQAAEYQTTGTDVKRQDEKRILARQLNLTFPDAQLPYFSVMAAETVAHRGRAG
jgi:hypothetical protein